MESSLASPAALSDRFTSTESRVTNEASSSGVSWAAVAAGAFVAAALALILLALGTGLGLSAVSPWTHVGASAGAIGVAAIVWLIVAQILASALGGYVAGRLRTKWANVHTDEVYFRDTAHGLLVWAVGVVITAALLASAATVLVGGAAQSGAPSGRGLEAGGGAGGVLDPNAYYVDALFRSDHPTSDPSDAATRSESARIFARALQPGDAPAGDTTYLARLVAARTGLTPADAEARVSHVLSNARHAADAARKALAYLSLWIFVALLSGAFFASIAATVGGRQRDNIQTV
jgi:hypothetical protein